MQREKASGENDYDSIEKTWMIVESNNIKEGPNNCKYERWYEAHKYFKCRDCSGCDNYLRLSSKANQRASQHAG